MAKKQPTQPGSKKPDDTFAVEFDGVIGRKANVIIAALGYTSRAEWIRQVVQRAVKDVRPEVEEKIGTLNREE